MHPDSVKLLKVLKAEHEKGLRDVNCSPFSEIQKRCRLTDPQLNSALRELVPLGTMVKLSNQGIDYVTITPVGLQLLETELAKSHFNLDRRLVIFSIIAALISALIGLLSLKK